MLFYFLQANEIPHGQRFGDSTTIYQHNLGFAQSEQDFKQILNLPDDGNPVVVIGRNGYTRGEPLWGPTNAQTALWKTPVEEQRLNHGALYGHPVLTVDMTEHKFAKMTHFKGDAQDSVMTARVCKRLYNSTLTYFELIPSGQLTKDPLTGSLRNFSYISNKMLIELNLDPTHVSSTEWESSKKKHPFSAHFGPFLWQVFTQNDPHLQKAIQLTKQIFREEDVEEFLKEIRKKIAALKKHENQLVLIGTTIKNEEEKGKGRIITYTMNDFFTVLKDDGVIKAEYQQQVEEKRKAMHINFCDRKMLQMFQTDKSEGRMTTIRLLLTQDEVCHEKTYKELDHAGHLLAEELKESRLETDPICNKLMQLYSLFNQWQEITDFFATLETGFSVQHIECINTPNGINKRQNVTYLLAERISG